uniref:RBR-type E3 ubiquitin transferase n=1 Tax=Meloidogyne javanica TaxID=6303 RepID=A0A915MJB2_MELJA
MSPPFNELARVQEFISFAHKLGVGFEAAFIISLNVRGSELFKYARDNLFIDLEDDLSVACRLCDFYQTGEVFDENMPEMEQLFDDVFAKSLKSVRSALAHSLCSIYGKDKALTFFRDEIFSSLNFYNRYYKCVVTIDQESVIHHSEYFKTQNFGRAIACELLPDKKAAAFICDIPYTHRSLVPFYKISIFQLDLGSAVVTDLIKSGGKDEVSFNRITKEMLFVNNFQSYRPGDSYLSLIGTHVGKNELLEWAKNRVKSIADTEINWNVFRCLFEETCALVNFENVLVQLTRSILKGEGFKIENSTTFPLRCAHQHCQFLAINDIRKVFGRKFTKIQDLKTFILPLLQRSLYSFVNNNDEFVWCKTTGCHYLIKVNINCQTIICPKCRNERCGGCGEDVHEGKNCEEARHALLLKDDHLLLKWKEEISEMCRFCPNKNCNMLIERTIEGCNHMECTNCKTHFCWICESFKSDNSRDIYRHMLEIHGSYGVDYAHLNMGNYWVPFDYYEDVEQPLPIMNQRLSREGLYGQLRSRRNSLTDSPLTGLSPSSGASNGDSADDIGGSTGISSSLSESFSDNQTEDKKTLHTFSTNFGLFEGENIDNIELEYVHDVLVGIKKQLIKQLKYNKWTEALAQAIITGDFYCFLRRFKMIMLCLRKRRDIKYKSLTNQQLAAFVANNIVERFCDQNEETTILMILLANHDKKFNCSVRNHGYCRIAHLLLKLLGDEDRVNLIEVIAKTSGKTALHLAVATGHPCQLRVLLALTDIDPNILDESGRAAIHYAVERNNLDMVKMLMWYGADISLAQSRNSKYNPSYISIHANPGATVDYWLRERVKAISQKMLTFARSLCARTFSIEKSISTPHFLLLNKISKSEIECQLNLHTKVTNFASQNRPRPRAFLFMIPIAFRTTDERSAASDPKIVRVAFPGDFYVAGHPILDSWDVNCTATKLLPVFASNGYTTRQNNSFFAYELPSSIEGLHRLTCRLGSVLNRENLLIAVQAFSCTELRRNKSKAD